MKGGLQPAASVSNGLEAGEPSRLTVHDFEFIVSDPEGLCSFRGFCEYAAQINRATCSIPDLQAL